MREALALFRELGDVRGQASALWGLAIASVVARDYPASKEQLLEGLKLYEQIDDGFGIAWSHHMLGLVALSWQEDLETSAHHMGQALRLFQRNEDRSGIVLALADFAVLARHAGETLRHYKLSGAADHLRKLTGADLVLNQIEGLDWVMAEQPPEGTPDRAPWDDGAALSFDEAVAYALEGSPPAG
jgi:hypothetical protein